MSATRWERITALFDEACERVTPERDAFLRAECGEDVELLRDVQALLDADGPLDGRITRALIDATQELVLESDQSGRMIGPYRLVRELGQGGMGAVYLAERIDGQFEQRVALKLIRLGMASAEVEARFRMERQILARLQHPGIARLLDGGVTPDGQPYFAMEYVEGRPIDDYCRDERLTIAQRLRLFESVCTAVAYAHANLVVHRDLKPDNILVTPQGTVRLLDFGIAKVIAADEDATIGLTTVGSRAMTPAYASPEQVLGQQVGTAADVYALGVILYELLAGVRPYNVKSVSPAEMHRAICEVDPEAPSARVRRVAKSTTVPPSETGADLGEPNVRRVQRQIAGDLDVICLKALRKEPERRYRTVDAMLEDVLRHRDGRPVLARPDTLRYRLRTMFRRRGPATLAMAAAIGLTVGLAALYTVQVRRERDVALLAARDATTRAAFLQELFETPGRVTVRADTVSTRAMLDRALRRLNGTPPDDVASRAEQLRLLADLYEAIGVTDQARALRATASAISRRAAGP